MFLSSVFATLDCFAGADDYYVDFQRILRGVLRTLNTDNEVWTLHNMSFVFEIFLSLILPKRQTRSQLLEGWICRVREDKLVGIQPL